ncbi:hypothetical protein FRC16_004908 [Serendipita sp. 398]|nr:hypothetical protein FRC16_004908 [Serendipita sp. 398]
MGLDLHDILAKSRVCFEKERKKKISERNKRERERERESEMEESTSESTTPLIRYQAACPVCDDLCETRLSNNNNHNDQQSFDRCGSVRSSISVIPMRRHH